MLCRTTLQTLLSVTLSRNWFVHNNILLNYFNLRNLITDCLINCNYFYKKNIVGKYFMLTEVNDPLFFCIITNPDKNVFKAVNCSAILQLKTL